MFTLLSVYLLIITFQQREFQIELISFAHSWRALSSILSRNFGLQIKYWIRLRTQQQHCFVFVFSKRRNFYKSIGKTNRISPAIPVWGVARFCLWCLKVLIDKVVKFITRDGRVCKCSGKVSKSCQDNICGGNEDNGMRECTFRTLRIWVNDSLWLTGSFLQRHVHKVLVIIKQFCFLYLMQNWSETVDFTIISVKSQELENTNTYKKKKNTLHTLIVLKLKCIFMSTLWMKLQV